MEHTGRRRRPWPVSTSGDLVYYARRGLVPTDVAIVGESAANADIVSPLPSDHRAVAATFRHAGCPEA